jgi:hypothetical protein
VVGRKKIGWVDDESNAERVTGPGPSYSRDFMHADNASIGKLEFLFLPRSQSGGVKSWDAGE